MRRRLSSSERLLAARLHGIYIGYIGRPRPTAVRDGTDEKPLERSR
jgi:hypothetical protein